MPNVSSDVFDKRMSVDTYGTWNDPPPSQRISAVRKSAKLSCSGRHATAIYVKRWDITRIDQKDHTTRSTAATTMQATISKKSISVVVHSKTKKHGATFDYVIRGRMSVMAGGVYILTSRSFVRFGGVEDFNGFLLLPFDEGLPMQSAEKMPPGPAANFRKRPVDDILSQKSYREAYKGFSFHACDTIVQDRPGTPFAASYLVKSDGLEQVIHKHQNGLVVVTLGKSAFEDEIQGIEFRVAETSTQLSSAAAKMLKGRKVNRRLLVHASDTLATITTKSGVLHEVKYAVCGTVEELNTRVTPELLAVDPLLDGFLAIMRPSGPFPPDHESLST